MTASLVAQASPDDYVSIKDFARRSTLSRATVYNIIAAGELPRPTKLTARRVGLPASAVEAWFAAKTEAA